MADAVGKPPAAGIDDLLRPDAGFHDDKVGAQLKAEEAAVRRAAQGKVAQTPRRIIKEPEQVGAASAFRPAQQESAEMAQIRRQRALVAGPTANPQQAAKRGGHPQQRQAGQANSRIQALFSSLTELETKRGARAAAPRAGGRTGPLSAEGDEVPPSTADAAQHRRVEAIDEGPEQRRQAEREALEQPQGETPQKEAAAAARFVAAQQRARYEVQQLVAGGNGFPLLPDAAAAFASLFAQLPHWPTAVPPGFVPATAEDFDAFFAWAFAPLEPNGDSQEAQLAAQQFAKSRAPRLP